MALGEPGVDARLELVGAPGQLGVAPATRRRVLTAIAELGHVRTESARQLRAGHSRFIGLVVLDVANPFHADVAAGVEATADERGMVVTMGGRAPHVRSPASRGAGPRRRGAALRRDQ